MASTQLTIGFPATGELTYNGYTFVGAHNVRVKERPIFDDSARTIKYVEVTISVTAIVAATESGSAASTDEVVESIRSKLMQQGGVLTFKNAGFGDDIVVNKPGSKVRDVNFGPIPGDFDWEPVGNDLSCEISWSVTTYVPECCAACQPRHGGLRAVNYQMDFAIDEDGDTTRTITGSLEIAMTRSGNAPKAAGWKRIPDTADAYWRLIRVWPLPGFLRRTTRRLNAAKNRLDFTITDQQLKTRNPYPAGCTKISAKHNVSWSRNKSARVNNSLDMEITHANGIHPVHTYQVFLAIARQRIFAARRNKRHAFIDHLSISEDIFGRSSSFSIRWRILGPVQDMLKDSGLWRPIGTKWNDWMLSLSNTTYAPYGQAQLHHAPAMDVIVDLCESGQESYQKVGLYQNRERSSRLALKNECPPAEESWMSYDPDLVVIARTSSDHVVTIQPVPEDKATGFDKNGEVKTDGPHFKDIDKANYKNEVQQTGSNQITVIFTGVAKRVCHKIPRPKLERLGNEQLYQVDSSWSHKVMANYLGLPVYRAVWRIVYKANDVPDEVISALDRNDMGVKNDNAVKPTGSQPSESVSSQPQGDGNLSAEAPVQNNDKEWIFVDTM